MARVRLGEADVVELAKLRGFPMKGPDRPSPPSCLRQRHMHLLFTSLDFLPTSIYSRLSSAFVTALVFWHDRYPDDVQFSAGMWLVA